MNKKDVNRMKKIFLALALIASLGACSTKTDNTERLSIAKVQREIKIGMSSSEVVSILGSPNMVTTDEQRRETWVYDKVATEASSNRSKGGVWLLLFYSGDTNTTSSTNQRTLTIIIKFDNAGKVRDFAYRTSSF